MYIYVYNRQKGGEIGPDLQRGVREAGEGWWREALKVGEEWNWILLKPRLREMTFTVTEKEDDEDDEEEAAATTPPAPPNGKARIFAPNHPTLHTHTHTESLSPGERMGKREEGEVEKILFLFCGLVCLWVVDKDKARMYEKQQLRIQVGSLIWSMEFILPPSSKNPLSSIFYSNFFTHSSDGLWTFNMQIVNI